MNIISIQLFLIISRSKIVKKLLLVEMASCRVALSGRVVLNLGWTVIEGIYEDWKFVHVRLASHRDRLSQPDKNRC